MTTTDDPGDEENWVTILKVVETDGDILTVHCNHLDIERVRKMKGLERIIVRFECIRCGDRESITIHFGPSRDGLEPVREDVV